MHQTQKKRCDTCDDLRGFQAFNPKSSTCKRCETTITILNYEKGISTKRTCVTCHKTKEACEGFRLNKQVGVFHTQCNECKKAYMLKYNKEVLGYGSSIKCTKGFVFNGNKLCKQCDTPRPLKHFYGRRLVCKVCLDVALDEQDKERRKQEKIDNGFYTKKNLEWWSKKTDRKRTIKSTTSGKRGTRDRFVRKFNSMKDEIFA